MVAFTFKVTLSEDGETKYFDSTKIGEEQRQVPKRPSVIVFRRSIDDTFYILK